MAADSRGDKLRWPNRTVFEADSFLQLQIPKALTKRDGVVSRCASNRKKEDGSTDCYRSFAGEAQKCRVCRHAFRALALLSFLTLVGPFDDRGRANFRLERGRGLKPAEVYWVALSKTPPQALCDSGFSELTSSRGVD